MPLFVLELYRNAGRGGPATVPIGRHEFESADGAAALLHASETFHEQLQAADAAEIRAAGGGGLVWQRTGKTP